ncbi:hypothetical protein ACVLB3_001730 [Pseudarthrobacter sp. PvP022]
MTRTASDDASPLRASDSRYVARSPSVIVMGSRSWA